MTEQKKTLRKDLLLIGILTVLLLGVMIALVVIEQTQGVIGSWSHAFYASVLQL